MMMHGQHLQSAKDGVCGGWLPARTVQGRQGVRQRQRHHVAAEQHGHLRTPPLPLQQLRIIPACKRALATHAGAMNPWAVCSDGERPIAHDNC